MNSTTQFKGHFRVLDMILPHSIIIGGGETMILFSDIQSLKIPTNFRNIQLELEANEGDLANGFKLFVVRSGHSYQFAHEIVAKDMRVSNVNDPIE